uniref:Ovule protein n=1 Tax=Heterorhabditis bacteriophora TaxID=37862 RepID=A0A1I7WJL4_HETBA
MIVRNASIKGDSYHGFFFTLFCLAITDLIIKMGVSGLKLLVNFILQLFKSVILYYLAHMSSVLPHEEIHFMLI